MAAEAERAAFLASDPRNTLQVSNLIAGAQNMSLNLKDFGGQEVF